MAEDDFTTAELEEFQDLNLQRKRVLGSSWIFSGTATSTRHELFLQREELRRKAAAKTTRRVSPDAQEARGSQEGLSDDKLKQKSSAADNLAITCQSKFVSISDRLIGVGNQSIPRFQEVLLHAPRTAEWNAVIAILDTGTTGNWISQRIVDRCRLAPQSGRSVEFLNFEGGNFQSDRTVQATWRGQRSRKTQVAIFRVADEGSPFDVLFGWTFLSNGDCESFSYEPADPTLVLVQSQIVEKERLKIEQGKVDAEARAAELERKRAQKKRQTQGPSSSGGSNASAHQSRGYDSRH